MRPGASLFLINTHCLQNPVRRVTFFPDFLYYDEENMRQKTMLDTYQSRLSHRPRRGVTLSGWFHLCCRDRLSHELQGDL
jgi:hypothetical protein